VIEENAAPAAPLPFLELDGSQIAHVLRANQVEPLVSDPAQIGCIFLRLEFFREIDGSYCVPTVRCAIPHISTLPDDCLRKPVFIAK
jgi:hypothetical protein